MKTIHKGKGKKTVCTQVLSKVLWTDKDKFVTCSRCKNIGGK